MSFTVYFFIQDVVSLQYLPILFGKFAVTSTFSLIFILVAESIPTNKRGSFFGVITALSRIGSMLGPLIADYLAGYAMLVYAGIGLICCLAAFGIRETHGKPMAETTHSDGK